MSRAPLGVVCGLLIALALGRPLGAQDRSVVEIGASVVRFLADSVTAGGPSARWIGTRERNELSGRASVGGVAGPGGASGFLELAGQRRHGLAAGWRAELGGEVGAVLTTGTRSASNQASSGLLIARVVRPYSGGGAWLGGSASIARRDPDVLGGHGLDAGVWWRWTGLQLVATLARESTAAQLFVSPGRADYAGTVPVRYAEGTFGIAAERDDASVSLTGMLRRDPGAEQLVEGGVIATATFWRSPARAFVVSVARQLPDFVRGADATQSVSLGVRLNEPSPASTRTLRARPVVFVAGDSTERRVSVRVSGAQRVEIMGDFSDWEPVTLTPAGGVFVATVAMASGSRRIVVRVDGGEWRPAANTPAVDDDFGGRVGLLLVP